MSNFNHFICPACGHDFYAKGAYATCDACQTFFYAAQSATCRLPQRSMSQTTAGPMVGENTANPTYWSK